MQRAASRPDLLEAETLVGMLSCAEADRRPAWPPPVGYQTAACDCWALVAADESDGAARENHSQRAACCREPEALRPRQLVAEAVAARRLEDLPAH